MDDGGELILGIETAGRTAAAALVRGRRVIGARSSAGPHSALLLPMIAELLSAHGRRPAELSLIGVARGPGAYTGLRVGIATAKALGRATGATVLGVPTLEAMASHAPPSARRVRVLLGAYKRKLLVATFAAGTDGVLALGAEPALIAARELSPPEEDELLVTDAPDLVLESLGEVDLVAVEGPGADAVALLAAARLADGADDEVYTLSPTYLRPPSVTLRRGGSP